MPTEKKAKKETKNLSQLEFEKKVLELVEKNLTSEKIGLELKKQGIHPKDYPKKILLQSSKSNNWIICIFF